MYSGSFFVVSETPHHFFFFQIGQIRLLADKFIADMIFFIECFKSSRFSCINSAIIHGNPYKSIGANVICKTII